MAGLKVPITVRFSDKEQKDLYETCIAYKELAEIRGAENDRLRKLVALQSEFAKMPCSPTKCKRYDEYCGYGVDEECHYEREIYDRMQELGIEASE